MGDGPRQIVLLGHIDTVPGEIPVRVESIARPLTPFPCPLVLYGRGSVDAKGPLSAFVDAVAACGPLPGWQIVVIGAVGEEQDSPGAQYVLPLYHPGSCHHRRAQRLGAGHPGLQGQRLGRGDGAAFALAYGRPG